MCGINDVTPVDTFHPLMPYRHLFMDSAEFESYFLKDRKHWKSETIFDPGNRNTPEMPLSV